MRRVPQARKVPWGRRVRRVRRAVQETPVDPQGRRVCQGWTASRGHQDRKAQKVPWGRKVQPDLKVIPADPQGRKVRKAWTVPQDRKALQVR